MATEYVVCEIADYNEKLNSRNAKLCKRFDNTVAFCAVIQPVTVKDCLDEVTIISCNEDYSKLHDSVFNCYLPENKTFETLSAEDILTSVL